MKVGGELKFCGFYSLYKLLVFALRLVQIIPVGDRGNRRQQRASMKIWACCRLEIAMFVAYT